MRHRGSFIVKPCRCGVVARRAALQRPQLERYLAVRDLVKPFADEALRFRVVASP